jgi:hypothetical protein
MVKYLLSGILGLIIGLAIGIAGTIIVYPFIFPPPEVNERIADITKKTLAASGEFIHPNPSDPVHWGKGGVSIYQQGNLNEVYLESDFEVGPGPAYHVYLSSGTDIKSNADFKNGVNLDIGTLKSFKGSQIYKVSSGSLDPAQYNSVVVWCVAFNQLITSANLSNNN